MAAHARRLTAEQGLRALSTPLGQPAPFMHCHADDTTIHAASPADAAAILAGSISLHCQATGARKQTAKSTGMGIGSMQHLVGPDADIGITFSAAGSATIHLGIPAQHRPRCCRPHSLPSHPAAPRQAHRTLVRLPARPPGQGTCRQAVLVSMFTYHATFVPMPADLLRQLCTSVYTFVAANRPAAAGAAHLFPSRAISARSLQQGGIALVDIPAHITVTGLATRSLGP